MTYALVTGASKGIGKSIAYELAKRGYNLLIVSRTESELENLAAELIRYFNIKVSYLALDLTQNDSPQKIAEWVKENKIPLSILVNRSEERRGGKECRSRWS